MKKQTLTLLTAIGLVGTAPVYAEDIPTFDLNTGELHIPKVEVLSSTGKKMGTYHSELHQVRDDPSRDFVVVRTVSVEDEPSNRHIARLFLRDLLSNGELEVADEILSPGAIIHLLDSFTPDFGTGPEAMKQIVGLYRSTFPDIDVVIDDVIAAGDKVIARFTINGTQKGDLPGIPATGLPISIAGIDIYQIKDGKIVEFWHDADTLGMMKALGAMPDM